ncbi:hypothetical protein [Singulisphaera sp. PoT]|uniref:hypothetical protein n=1 Tax=Singulisphaera sp. PoT TaxID=3411797 RepID=UPI003BF4D6B5
MGITHEQKGERVGRCRLTLTSNDADYAERPIASEMVDVSRAFRQTHGGDIYDVAQTMSDCPDFIFRREWLDPRG